MRRSTTIHDSPGVRVLVTSTVVQLELVESDPAPVTHEVDSMVVTTAGIVAIVFVVEVDSVSVVMVVKRVAVGVVWHCDMAVGDE